MNQDQRDQDRATSDGMPQYEGSFSQSLRPVLTPDAPANWPAITPDETEHYDDPPREGVNHTGLIEKFLYHK